MQGYTTLYEEYLEGWRDRDITLLELGVLRGASLRMWREYFTRATIIGLDLDTTGARDVEDVRLFEMDQADEAGLTSLALLAGGFDIVIDDASHDPSKTDASYHMLWPYVKPGGLYVVEDCQLSGFYGNTYYPVGLGICFIRKDEGNGHSQPR